MDIAGDEKPAETTVLRVIIERESQNEFYSMQQAAVRGKARKQEIMQI